MRKDETMGDPSRDSVADDAVDLLVYAIKYLCWLNAVDDGPENVNERLAYFLGEVEEVSTEGQALNITFVDVAYDFDNYADNVDLLDTLKKSKFAHDLIVQLAPIARDLWYEETHHAGDDYLADLGQ